LTNSMPHDSRTHNNYIFYLRKFHSQLRQGASLGGWFDMFDVRGDLDHQVFLSHLFILL
jgi:hypothetical protein